MKVRNKETMIKIKKFIEDYYEKYNVTPTQRLIAEHIGLSVSNINGYLNEMVENGMLTKGEMSQRKFSSSKGDDRRLVPLVGAVACGTPILAEENIERYLSFSSTMLGNGNYFLLRANGNSMIKAGVSDGDLVLVKQQNTAEEGQIVVALIEDGATLKRFYTDGKRKQVRLHPENDDMEDMYFKNITIQGVAVKVIKDLV